MQEAKLACTGHVLTENRCGLAVDGAVTIASGTAERDAALALAEGMPRGSTLGADKAYDTADFVADVRAWASPRTWPRTRPTCARPSTAAPPATSATP